MAALQPSTCIATRSLTAVIRTPLACGSARPQGLRGGANHVILGLAHRVQRPHENINHALVLGGKQGIGKDSMLEPVKHAIGSWNFAEVSPQNVLGNFNGFLKSVMMRISETRDLGEVDRFKFYDHAKTLTAAPPDVLRVNEKNLREHYVPNVTGVYHHDEPQDRWHLPARR
jgi:hypothetical protein